MRVCDFSANYQAASGHLNFSIHFHLIFFFIIQIFVIKNINISVFCLKNAIKFDSNGNGADGTSPADANVPPEINGGNAACSIRWVEPPAPSRRGKSDQLSSGGFRSLEGHLLAGPL